MTQERNTIYIGREKLVIVNAKKDKYVLSNNMNYSFPCSFSIDCSGVIRITGGVVMDNQDYERVMKNEEKLRKEFACVAVSGSWDANPFYTTYNMSLEFLHPGVNIVVGEVPA